MKRRKGNVRVFWEIGFWARWVWIGRETKFPKGWTNKEERSYGYLVIKSCAGKCCHCYLASPDSHFGRDLTCHLFEYLGNTLFSWIEKCLLLKTFCPNMVTLFSSASLARHRAWRITTSTRLSHPGRSRPPCTCCYLGSWPSTPCPRALRLSPSTPAPGKYNMPSRC